MGSLSQVRDRSFELSMLARNLPLLHKPPGAAQVADGIHLVIINLLLDFV